MVLILKSKFIFTHTLSIISLLESCSVVVQRELLFLVVGA